MGAPFPHFIASFPVNSDMFFASASMKLLPPRSAHSYQQDSQSNTAGPPRLQGEPPQHSPRDRPSSSSTHHIPPWSRQEGLVWPKPPPAQPVSTAQSSAQQPQPSSLQFLGYPCRICEEERWVKAAGSIPSTWTQEKPTCYTFIVCTSEKSLKWLTVMWLYDQGSYHNLKNLKKMQAK